MVSRAQVLCGYGRNACPARGLVLQGQSRWRLVRRKSLLSSLVERKRVEKKISPDCAPTQEPKAAKNRIGRKPLDLFLGTQHPPLHVPFCARHDARCPFVPTASGGVFSLSLSNVRTCTFSRSIGFCAIWIIISSSFSSSVRPF